MGANSKSLIRLGLFIATSVSLPTYLGERSTDWNIFIGGVGYLLIPVLVVIAHINHCATCGSWNTSKTMVSFNTAEIEQEGTGSIGEVTLECSSCSSKWRSDVIDTWPVPTKKWYKVK